MNIAKHLKKHFNALKSDRNNWDDHWREVSELVMPRKENIFERGSVFTRGEKRGNTRIYETTAIQSNVLLASALHGMLTNPSQPWFELTTGDEFLDTDDNARRWLQESTDRIHQILIQSNFHTEIHEAYMDLGCFGTSVLRVEEDDESIVRFQSRPIYEVWIDENSKGEVDTVFREFNWTVRKIAQRFGEDSLTDELKNDLRNNSQRKHKIVHAVLPSKDIPQDLRPKLKKFASIWFLNAKEHILEIKGFNENPYIVSRWSKTSGEMYGRSPAMAALPDIKMINDMAKVTIRAAQKAVDPPLMMESDGIVLPLNVNPGGLNYKRPGAENPVPLITGSRPDIGEKIQEAPAQRIRESFFIDQLQLGFGPQMTATEVRQRTEEKLRLLGPVLARQQFELLKPLIDRLFGMMMRKNLFLAAPEVLEGKNVTVRYSSQIAKAQRLAESDSLLRAVELIGPIAEADPTVLDNIDGDAAIRIIAKMVGLRQDMLRDDDEVIEIREQRAQAQQQQADNEQQSMDLEKLQQVQALG
jgi:hypothetical protein